MEVLIRLYDTIESAGIPTHGVSIGPPIRIDFKPEATDQQRAQAAAIVAAFDTRPRKPKSVAKLMEEIKKVNGSARTDLLDCLLAYYLREHPRIARKLGIPIDGDEVE